MAVTPTTTVPDPKSQVTVNGGAPGTAATLSLGLTEVTVEVTSPDASNKQVKQTDTNTGAVI